MIGLYATVRDKIDKAPWWQVPVWVVILIVVAVLAVLWVVLHNAAKNSTNARIQDLELEKHRILNEDRMRVGNGIDVELDQRLINVVTDLKKAKDSAVKLNAQQEVLDLAKDEDVSWEDVRRAWESLP